ncbi:MAG: ribonuclease protein subunit [Candidatus Woesearchaeota archaeon]|nr:ribonuclease protein subunit [Candidatus Woesearchaeota archaeon]MDN5328031.1 ribonuclease protein subunit [Candidatus Woesearchaeota archaeon]
MKKSSELSKIYNEWFKTAKKVFFKNPELSKKMVEDILYFSRKTKTSIPKEVKRFICKKCHSVLIPGINLRVRLQKNHVVYLCKECKTLYRYPFIKEKKQTRQTRKSKE